MALADNRGQRLFRGFVEEDRGNDEVEVPVGKAGRRGIALREVYALAERFGTRVGVTQQRGTDVDGVHLGLRKGVDEGQGAVADGTAEIENSLRLEVRIPIAHELRGRTTDVVVHRTHHAERIEVDAAIVERAGRHVACATFAAVAARHTVDIDTDCIFRQREIGVQTERP